MSFLLFKLHALYMEMSSIEPYDYRPCSQDDLCTFSILNFQSVRKMVYIIFLES